MMFNILAQASISNSHIENNIKSNGNYLFHSTFNTFLSMGLSRFYFCYFIFLNLLFIYLMKHLNSYINMGCLVTMNIMCWDPH